jgi:multidrug efflux pump subunit AcrB
MRLTHFFIDHPRFAAVLSIFVTLFGLASLTVLPVAQYPEIVPPTVQITTSYPGASADTIARTVATPLEQEINGVENMIYLNSQSTGDGNLSITVTFRIGTDLNVAQMLTQNRVQDALSRLPDDVQREGVQVRKTTPSILLGVHFYSPDKSRNLLYLSNYITLHVKDVLARLAGVADIQFYGERQYAMRVWLEFRRQVGQRGHCHDPSRNPPCSGSCFLVPSDLARNHHSGRGNSGFAGWNIQHSGSTRDLDQ